MRPPACTPTTPARPGAPTPCCVCCAAAIGSTTGQHSWPPAAIAGLPGCDPSTVRRWIHGYNQDEAAARPTDPELAEPAWAAQGSASASAGCSPSPPGGRSVGSASTWADRPCPCGPWRPAAYEATRTRLTSQEIDAAATNGISPWCAVRTRGTGSSVYRSWALFSPLLWCNAMLELTRSPLGSPVVAVAVLALPPSRWREAFFDRCSPASATRQRPAHKRKSWSEDRSPQQTLPLRRPLPNKG